MKKVGKKVGLLATNLGYDDKSNTWVYWSKEYKGFYSTNVKGGISRNEETFKQPRQTELQSWLRKKFFIEVYVEPDFYRDSVEGYNPMVHGIGDYSFNTEKTYEKAFEKALLLALNHLTKVKKVKL